MLARSSVGEFFLRAFTVFQAIIVLCSNASGSLIVATAAEKGLVVCADLRGVKGDGAEVLSTKLFIVSPGLVFGSTGDTVYRAGNREVFNVFSPTNGHLRGVSRQQQIFGK